jgi:hypothetical protein
MIEQLQMVEPQGSQFIDLAAKHLKEAKTLHAMADVYDVQGWQAVAAELRTRALTAEELGAMMHILAEFEALGGVA